jgi:hypothetical protein
MRTHRKLIVDGVLLVAAVVLLAQPALASEIAFRLDDVAGVGLTPATTFGVEFEVVQSIDVVSLGLADYLADGFTDVHEVGLWDTSSALLASVTFSPGNSGLLDPFDGFRYLDLAAPLRLLPGIYRIGAYFPDASDDDRHLWTSVNDVSGYVRVIGGVKMSGSGLLEPTLPDVPFPGHPEIVTLGANFQFEDAVPEPATWLLLTFGAAAIAVRRRRRAASVRG